MKSPFFSIIIPMFNAGKTIGSCLESLINQSFKDFEIVIINDGSIDNSQLICKEFLADKRINLVYQKNQGVSVSRNRGISLSSGKYVVFVDADDWIEHDMLEVFYSYIVKSNSDILIGGIIFDYINYSKYLGVKESMWGSNTSTIREMLLSLDKLNLIGYSGGRVIKREIIKKNNICFDPIVKNMEDFLFNCKVLFNSRSICIINQNKYHYIVKSNSLSSSYSPELYETFNEISKLLSQLFAKHNIDSLLLNNTYVLGIQTCVHNIYQSGSPLDRKHRISFLEEILNEKKVQYALSRYDNKKDVFTKIFCFLYSINDANIMDSAYRALFWSRNKFKNTYNMFRKIIFRNKREIYEVERVRENI
ncbi:glycosyl transferase [Paenibacillus sp. J31TS4]|uniref:glycosyltransferase family 2 protein n=1 Tax=Paenibacillus sp. J31TS4 TaxID=2807195 RepID=UPI001B24E27C|nr:glycosyltransferase family 2 protein [Paenibacillus sp. J31TS4]GIP39895.1 glycosyl transferase [Paenibacillus sp. J31TS4]